MTTSPTITDVSARLAAFNLYTSRGIIDPEDTRMNQLQMHKDYAESVLDDMLASRIVIEATRAAPTTYPTPESYNVN